MELKILRLVINRSIILDGPTFYNHGCLSCVAVTLTHVIVNVKRVHFLATQIKILTKRIARLHKTNIYIMVIHQIFPKTPLQAPICLVKLWAGAGRCREGKSFGRKGTC